MGWLWRKSKKIGPMNVTVSNRGMTTSFGSRWFRWGSSTNGRTYTSMSIPGTGLRRVQYARAMPAPKPRGLLGLLVLLFVAAVFLVGVGAASIYLLARIADQSARARETAIAVVPKIRDTTEVKTKGASTFDPAKRLAQARQYMPTAPEVAKRWLHEIVEKHPESSAAGEAKKLLEEK